MICYRKGPRDSGKVDPSYHDVFRQLIYEPVGITLIRYVLRHRRTRMTIEPIKIDIDSIRHVHRTTAIYNISVNVYK